MDHHHKEQRWGQQNQRGNRRDLIVTRHAGVIEQQRQRGDIRRPDEESAGKLIQRLQKTKMLAATIPGAACGSTMCQKVYTGPAPGYATPAPAAGRWLKTRLHRSTPNTSGRGRYAPAPPCDTAVQSPLIKQSGNIHVYRQVRKGLRDKK